MLRHLSAASAAFGALLIATSAQAQARAGAFGDQGQFIISADRLFPLFSFNQNTVTDNSQNPSRSSSETGTAISLFWGQNSLGLGAIGGNSAGVTNFYTVPRLGFDYVVIPNLTIGGDLIAWFTLGGNTSTSQGSSSQSQGNPGGNTFGIAPRVGYILGMNDLLSIWLRGGVSYYNGNTSLTNPNCTNNQNSDTSNVNEFGIDLDPQLVVSPIPHFALTVGPTLDWGVAGGVSTTDQVAPQCSTTTSKNQGYTSLFFGLNAGLLGWF